MGACTCSKNSRKLVGAAAAAVTVNWRQCRYFKTL